MSDEEVRDESYDMLLAGQKTSANALTWCFYYLSRSPAVRARLEAEMDKVLGGRPPTMEDCDRLPNTRAMFDEALRVAPPTYIVGLNSQRGLSAWRLPHPQGNGCAALLAHPSEGGKILPCGWRVQPERWLGSGQPQHPRHVYVPFGSGLRTCIGATFARMEMGLALSAITQRWRVEVISEEHPEVITMGNLQVQERPSVHGA